MIDWKTLSVKCSGYTTLTSTKDPQTGNILDTVYAGLRANLSDIVAGFPAGGASGLAIFVDTLVLDTPTLDARGVTILARSIDVSACKREPLGLVPPASDVRVVEVIAGGTTGGSLELASKASEAHAYTVPTGQSPLQASYYFLREDGTVSTQLHAEVADLADLITRPWALTALQAGFTAAGLLGDKDDAESLGTAASMLQWIVTCIRSVSVPGITVPDAFSELYSQAAALLVTLNVAPGSYFVPVLSSAFYKKQTDVLVAALQSYEADLNTLTLTGNISQAIQSVSATLVDVSSTELDPLNTELQQVRDDLDGLASAVNTLSVQYFMQQVEAKSNYTLLVDAIQQQRIDDWLSACFNLATSVVSLGAAIAKTVVPADPDPSGLGDAAKAFAEASKGFYDAAAALASGPGIDMTMVDQARQLMAMQQALMTSFQTGVILWAQAVKNVTDVPVLPTALSAVSIDPSLAWDNYMIRARTSIAGLKPSVGSGAQQPANEYLASLEILAQYGKAINTKMVAYTQQLARGVVLQAQIAAAASVVERWKQLEAKATSDEEKLAALKGILLLRSDSIKRSLIVSWTYYRNSYFYLYFQKPPYTVNTDMNAAQLKDTFASVVSWVGQLYGDTPGGPRITLPSSNVKVSLSFPILKSGAAVSNGNYALLTPAVNGNGPTLTWTVPLGTEQFVGVLPGRGDVAVWITSANFFLDGITPNSVGNVLLNVSTSGSYQNGFGPAQGYNFVTKGLAKDYAYSVAGPSVYNAWDIDSQVYQMPTPFTQWMAQFDPSDSGDPSTATKLRVDLTVSYRNKPSI